MSATATFNWAYKPGVTNKYGITINASADNVRPSNACYVALFGNDITGNGSRQYPYRTIAKAIATVSGIIILGSGVYREGNINPLSSTYTFIGDGDVTIDFSYYTFFIANTVNTMVLYNMKMMGADGYLCGNGAGLNLQGSDSLLNRCNSASTGNINALGSGSISNFIFNNISTNIIINSQLYNCTFYNCVSINFLGSATSIDVRACIFSYCNINFNIGSTKPINTVFNKCNFRFTASNQAGGAIYPITPTGYTYISAITALLSAYSTAYPVILVPLDKCIVEDPLFNNEAIGDYSLAFNSPAKNLSYFGTFVGARSIGQSIKARATESSGGFEFASAVNLTITDDSIILTNPALNAQVDTKPIVNILGREIANLPSYGFNADRNGQYIDSIVDLSATVYAAGDTLPALMPFIVENGAIIYNGATYQPGDRSTTVAAATTFSTVAAGNIREITEAPERHTIMIRFTDGGSAVTTGTFLITGYYYYVISGSVVYDSNTYNAGDIFKAVDTNSFSGTASVIIAFSTESFQHYEPGIRPTSNNVGDTRTGAIIRGNGDPAYVRGGIGVQEFPINAKFIQIRYIIRVTNLKP